MGSLRYYNLSAKKGNILAKAQLSKMYYNGFAVKKDKSHALKIAKKIINKLHSLALAEKNNPFASYMYGYFFDHGIYVKKDMRLAKSYYFIAANSGIAAAQANLGLIYFNDHDYDKARYWYKKAVAQGNIYAQNNLAVLYENGQGVKMDLYEARRLFQEASRTNNPTIINNVKKINEKINKLELVSKDEENLNKMKNFRFPGVNCSEPSLYVPETNFQIKELNKKIHRYNKCLVREARTNQDAIDSFEESLFFDRVNNRWETITEEEKRQETKMHNELDSILDQIHQLNADFNDKVDNINEAHKSIKHSNNNNYNRMPQMYKKIQPTIQIKYGTY